MEVKKPKPKKCKGCSERFIPARPLQTACSTECAIKVGRANSLKKMRVSIAAKKKALKTRSKWLSEAQAAVNKYVRLRDAGLPCISCGRHHQGQMHAGHYKSVGAHPEMRFDPANIHLQCMPCNSHLSGNILNYRAGLAARYGIGYVEALEAPHPAKKYTIPEIQDIKALFTRMAKDYRLKDGLPIGRGDSR